MKCVATTMAGSQNFQTMLFRLFVVTGQILLVVAGLLNQHDLTSNSECQFLDTTDLSPCVPCTAEYPQQMEPRILPDDDTKSGRAYPDIEILRDGTYAHFCRLCDKDTSTREEELRESEKHLQFYMSNGSIILFTCALCPFTLYVYLNRKCGKNKSVYLLHVPSKKPLLYKNFLDASVGRDPISISCETVDSRRKDEELFLTDVR